MRPTFIVIGAAKCGTTALHQYLSLHPDIQMSAIKETNYFAPADSHYEFGRIATIEEYERLFHSSCAVRGESSPSYSEHPWRPGVPERMHKLIPDAKLLYCVRDPIERMQALHAHLAEFRVLQGFEEELGDIHDPQNRYVCGSRYMTQLERFLEFYPRTNVMVINQHDLRHDRHRTLMRVFRFLGASDEFRTDRFDAEHNVSNEKRAHSRLSHRVAHSTLLRSTLAAAPERVRRMMLSRGRHALKRSVPSSTLRSTTRAALVEIFTPEVAGLRAFTAQDFASWSIEAT